MASGEHVIGDWPVDAIDITHVPEGIKVKAEGEVLLLDISDRDAFAQAAASDSKPKRLTVPKRAAKTVSDVSPQPAAAKSVKVKTPKAKTPKVRGESKLDAFLARAGSIRRAKLPNWVFGRWGIAAAVALVAFCVIFAEPCVQPASDRRRDCLAPRCDHAGQRDRPTSPSSQDHAHPGGHRWGRHLRGRTDRRLRRLKSPDSVSDEFDDRFFGAISTTYRVW